MFQIFYKEPLCWSPTTVSRIPIPQLVALWLWREAHGIRKVSMEEAIELLEQRKKVADASAG